MVRLKILCSFVLIPAVFGAPTVHLQNEYYESTSVPSVPTPDKNSVALDNRGSFDQVHPTPQKPHIVEPTWITVTMPPSFPSHYGQSGQPPIMQPYYAYIPVPPMNQPWSAPWPMYHPPMPVLPPLASNHLCNQPANPYRVT